MQFAVQSSIGYHTHAFSAGADPAIGEPGGRLPLWATLSEKTGFFRL